MFNLPPEITLSAKDRIDGQWVYTFRHKDLGNIGRIRLKGLGNNTMINVDIVGHSDDPMTQTRREIFEPIGMAIANQMESITGKATEKPVPTPLPTHDKKLVESKLMQCERCDAFVAMLIFADNGWTPADLEDYAQLMYQEYVRMNVPTWVIGSMLRDSIDEPALIMKVWPDREPPCRMKPNQFNEIIYKIQQSHCS